MADSDFHRTFAASKAKLLFSFSETKAVAKKTKAQMAESVDALVSNTSGATRAGSTPALGTMLTKARVLQG